MRPLSLAVAGFTAFRDRQDVSFADLDLFVITGPTGAGKTSLLDAMVFALYGQVPRLGGRQGAKDLVSLGQAEARVSFEFSVQEKGHYRVARRLGRARGNQSVTFEQHQGGEWTPVVDQGGVRVIDPVITETVGLDFDSFCRAVVLPQGEFHRFLKGDPGERRKVLFSLLGVNYFQRMAEIARTRMNVLKAGIARTEEIIDGQYGDATDDLIAGLQTLSAAASERSAIVAGAFRAADERMQVSADQQRRAQALSAQLVELQAVAPRLDELARVCQPAESAAGQAEARLAEAAGLTASRGVGVERADEAVAALEAAQGTLERLARVAAAADALRDAAADEARALKGLQEAEAQAQAAAATQATAEREQAQTESALATAQTAFEAATAGLDHARRGWERFREGAAAAAKLDAETAAARNEIEVRSAAAQAAGAAAEAVEATLTAACAELNERRRNAAIHQISAGLRPGDPCPVCGVALASAVHIDAGAQAGLDAAAEAESSLRQALAVAQRDATREEAQTEATTTRLADLEQRLMAALGEAKDLAAAMAELESRTEAVAAREEAAAGRRAELEARRSECESARRRGSTAAAQAAGCSAAAESARATVSEVRRRSDEASTALADHFDGVVPLDASEQVAAQRGRLAGALDAARSARTARDAAARDESAARATAEGERRRLGEIDVALAGLRARAEAVARTLAGEIALGVPPGVNGDRGASITGVRAWGETAGAAVARERDQTTARSTTVQAEVVSIAAGLGWDCASGADALAALQRADREAGQAVVRAAGAVERAVERVTQRRALEAQIADERRQVAVLGELAQDLRQDRFGEYIVQETLGVLAARASEELLRISDGRYSLVTDEGDFDVVDHANADERRSVKTLSGGETFLASLSLALSLSRHIGELASEGLGAKLEAVFIDEGFGTLDPATLDEVIDALERLREDDLIVGVISHVPELAQRIGIGLEVRKDEGRSQVIMNLESPASAP